MNHQTIPTLAEAKAGAKQFRARMKELGHEVSHSHALEATAAAFRFSDWATFRAAIENHQPKTEPEKVVDLLSSVKAYLTGKLIPLSDRELYTTAIDHRNTLAAAAIDGLDSPARYFLMYPEAYGWRGPFTKIAREFMRQSALAHLNHSLNATINGIAGPRLKYAVRELLSNAGFLDQGLPPKNDYFFTGGNFARNVSQRDVSVDSILALVSDRNMNTPEEASFRKSENFAKDGDVDLRGALARLSDLKLELADHLLDQMLGLGLMAKLFDIREFVRTEIDTYFGGDHARTLMPKIARYVEPDVFNDIRNGRPTAADIVGRGYTHAVTLPDGIYYEHRTLVKKFVSEDFLTGLSEAWTSFAPSLGNSHVVTPSFLLFRNACDAQKATAQIVGSQLGELYSVRKWDRRAMGDDYPVAWDALSGTREPGRE